jgi:hypothetical protein
LDNIKWFDERRGLNMDYEEMLLALAKKVSTIQIPNIMNASDMSLRQARIQKDEVLREIHRIRKLMKSEDEV